jgi:septum formation protein
MLALVMPTEVLLASTSPRRATLLREAGLSFRQVDPGLSDADEEALAREALALGCDPPAVARRLALAKLLATLAREAGEGPALAADTFLVHRGALLGKAAHADQARELLWRLRGERHEVLSGVAVRDERGALRTGTCSSAVEFTAFAAEALEAFLATGLWRGKAGAYGVQDPETAPLVARVEGSPSNVKGLPLEVALPLLGGAP